MRQLSQYTQNLIGAHSGERLREITLGVHEIRDLCQIALLPLPPVYLLDS